MMPREPYIGIHDDLFGGMTDIGRIIRDAWAFGLIPETETCRGWQAPALEALWEQVQQHWGRHGFLVRNLPDEIRDRYLRIQDEAIRRAKTHGWDPEPDDDA